MSVAIPLESIIGIILLDVLISTLEEYTKNDVIVIPTDNVVIKNPILKDAVFLALNIDMPMNIIEIGHKVRYGIKTDK
jgi:hypothetical protein